MPRELTDLLTVLGAVALVALVVLFWVLSTRKDRKHGRKHHHHQHRKGYREQFKTNAGGIKELIRQHGHRHRREHRPINPTLAQTGGLPPLREADSPPPTPPPQ